ncbi:Replicase polyprotein 1a [Frankliniella fusca]|uniref:Replicase polyprotein 1a n=1 Tax=Frankliniella fusca TaxID=407009 RepID=A0AAE1H4D7_9NEOP|nr:Replicase polyprotein 1a [Frankliniella fusca]
MKFILTYRGTDEMEGNVDNDLKNKDISNGSEGSSEDGEDGKDESGDNDDEEEREEDDDDSIYGCLTNSSLKLNHTFNFEGEVLNTEESGIKRLSPSPFSKAMPLQDISNTNMSFLNNKRKELFKCDVQNFNFDPNKSTLFSPIKKKPKINTVLTRKPISETPPQTPSKTPKKIIKDNTVGKKKGAVVRTK